MNNRIMTIVENIYQILHAGDVSLAVKIGAKNLQLVSCRRSVNCYRIKSVDDVPLDEKVPLGKQILTAKKALGVNPHFTTVLLPRASTLLKKIEIPLMSESEIAGYLFQHVDRLLLPGISTEKFSIHYKILAVTSTELVLLVLLQHRCILEKYRQELTDLQAFQIIAGNTVLDNLLMISDDKFSGVLVDICAADYLMLFYKRGKFTTLYTGKIDGEREFEKDVLTALDEAFGPKEAAGEYQYLISGNGSSEAALSAFFERVGLQPFRKKLPFPQNSYLSTAAACLNLFLNREDNFDMLDRKMQQRRRETYYQHLLKKSMLLIGGFLILLILLFSIAESQLEQAVQARSFQERSLQPLIRERDSLNVDYALIKKKMLAYSLPIQRQSNSANYLYQIAESLPERIWLTSAEIAPAGEAKISIQLVGLSPETEDVSQWMRLLEGMGFPEHVVLQDISMLEGGKIKRKWRLTYPELRQFRIQLDAQL